MNLKIMQEGLFLFKTKEEKCGQWEIIPPSLESETESV